ncbi:basic membrane protein A [Bradyrhizobium diazoefficiens]|uniref:BMP family ABC transporter substrate-binding protein n=2 Tax=Bradyrhizobium diazoefficiens TaxID=1355477 RepID=A0A809XZ29_9BRAD|nr:MULTISPECIES: BMP family ABC transporter substrate-binding protein [Bradyrhizobium]MBP1063582.1 simple sugar transport system substrate-binding protein [Bradyrhizobium japonicum]APO51549.1 DNA-binding protein [Bradyrhizobium diazoefficiens]KOY06508.1 DNA-binding protein [Bradyrhizobium diazoefficiens]MCD9293103.1 BMP family ABC transporter substrate-binding protein [Bradyrhizobium diazoefficiens]MCD9812435.1 BMP family ABC transporter substrate-binding protein [Bradyrhizobium diazoefficiens
MRKSLLALAAGLLLAGSVSAASAADKLKVGFIYLGPVGDLGWTYQHEQGRLALVKELGDKIETTTLENVPEGPDAERAIEQLVRAGNKLIFTTSFGYMDPTLKVAKKYPNVHFEHATGYKRDKNMSTYSAKWYQGRYIQGLIAAKMSKSGVLGYIGSFPIPEVVSGINATILAAQTINPNIKVKIIWANTWFDPGKEADAAKALIDQGADVIMQHTDSPAAMQIASERGKLAFGQDSEMIKFGPKTQLTSILDTWGPYYIERVKAELAGTWKSEDTWGGLDSHMFAMAPYTNMPDDVKKMAEDAQAAITAGKLHPFKCPIVGQDGKEVECKGGANLADGQILGMNFYVKGIDDKLPGK